MFQHRWFNIGFAGFLLVEATWNKLVKFHERTHTDTYHVELKASLEQFLLNLAGDAVETDMALGENGLGRLLHSHGRHGCGFG